MGNGRKKTISDDDDGELLRESLVESYDKHKPTGKSAKAMLDAIVGENTGQFKAGNQFWRQRSTHGRDKILSDPRTLWDAATQYFDWCDNNPLETIEYFGKDATPCTVYKMRAYTWQGLEGFLEISSLKNYRKDKSYADFFPILTRIESIIYTQKFEGAAAGLLNATIVARDLGLRDKVEETHKGELTVVRKVITGMRVI